MASLLETIGILQKTWPWLARSSGIHRSFCAALECHNSMTTVLHIHHSQQSVNSNTHIVVHLQNWYPFRIWPLSRLVHKNGTNDRLSLFNNIIDASRADFWRSPFQIHFHRLLQSCLPWIREPHLWQRLLICSIVLVFHDIRIELLLLFLESHEYFTVCTYSGRRR